MALHPLLEILLRHDGACPHAVNRREWGSEMRSAFHFVMAGLDPAIHVLAATKKAWMPGTRPGMTTPGHP
jgi:hypothetical protein